MFSLVTSGIVGVLVTVLWTVKGGEWLCCQWRHPRDEWIIKDPGKAAEVNSEKTGTSLPASNLNVMIGYAMGGSGTNPGSLRRINRCLKAPHDVHEKRGLQVDQCLVYIFFHGNMADPMKKTWRSNCWFKRLILRWQKQTLLLFHMKDSIIRNISFHCWP